jgi:hypothetical protein
MRVVARKQMEKYRIAGGQVFAEFEISGVNATEVATFGMTVQFVVIDDLIIGEHQI